MRNYDIRWRNGNLKVILFNLYTFKNNCVRKKSYKVFQNQYLILTRMTDDWKELKDISKDCETLVCGSDQIWNTGLTRRLHPAYFLEFSNKFQKCISYAPSISLSKIPEQYEEQLRQILKDFTVLSVRENQTAHQLEQIVERKVFCVLDPTLLHETDFYDKLLEGYSIKVPKKYIFVYCLHLASLAPLKKAAEEYAMKNEAEIVYFNKFNIHKRLYKSNTFKHGPKAFLYAIKHADFIIGDSFHVAVFSVLYKK